MNEIEKNTSIDDFWRWMADTYQVIQMHNQKERDDMLAMFWNEYLDDLEHIRNAEVEKKKERMK